MLRHFKVRNRLQGTSSRASQAVAARSGSVSTGFALTAPDKGGRVSVPIASGGLEPGDDFLWCSGVLTSKSAPGENALDGLGHVQPATSDGGVEGHNAVLHQPTDQLGALVTGKIIQNKEHFEGR